MILPLALSVNPIQSRTTHNLPYDVSHASRNMSSIYHRQSSWPLSDQHSTPSLHADAGIVTLRPGPGSPDKEWVVLSISPARYVLPSRPACASDGSSLYSGCSQNAGTNLHRGLPTVTPGTTRRKPSSSNQCKPPGPPITSIFAAKTP